MIDRRNLVEKIFKDAIEEHNNTIAKAKQQLLNIIKETLISTLTFVVEDFERNVRYGIKIPIDIVFMLDMESVMNEFGFSVCYYNTIDKHNCIYYVEFPNCNDTVAGKLGLEIEKELKQIYARGLKRAEEICEKIFETFEKGEYKKEFIRDPIHGNYIDFWVEYEENKIGNLSNQIKQEISNIFKENGFDELDIRYDKPTSFVRFIMRKKIS